MRDELEEAAKDYQRAEKRLTAARKALLEKVVAAATSDLSQSEVARLSGYTREHVRRLWRAAGIEAE